jgi:hypothetical protein
MRCCLKINKPKEKKRKRKIIPKATLSEILGICAVCRRNTSRRSD